MTKSGGQFTSVHVGFMVEEVAPGEVLFRLLTFLLFVSFNALLHIHIQLF